MRMQDVPPSAEHARLLLAAAAEGGLPAAKQHLPHVAPLDNSADEVRNNEYRPCDSIAVGTLKQSVAADGCTAVRCVVDQQQRT
jgi:hypothetical protein